MGLEGLAALLPVLFIAVLTLLIRVLSARRKNVRRPSSRAAAPPAQDQSGPPPEPWPTAPASPTQLSPVEHIQSLQAAKERTAAPKEQQEPEPPRGLLREAFSPPPEKPAASARPRDRLTPLQRAVIWAEILGPPKAEG